MFKEKITFKKANEFVSGKYGEGSAFSRIICEHLVDWTVTYYKGIWGDALGMNVEGCMKWVPYVLLWFPLNLAQVIWQLFNGERVELWTNRCLYSDSKFDL